MKKVRLFIACSLDGYIARENESLDWLDAIPNPKKSDFGYGDFIAGIGEIIMGRKTYEWVARSGYPWPYEDNTYIISKKDEIEIDTPKTYLMNVDWVSKVKEMKKEEGKDIWLCGGGTLISAFLDERLIDEMILSIIPIVLGAGLPLFPGKPLETQFQLNSSKQFDSGVVNLSYRKENW